MAYNHNLIEEKWQKYWEENKTYYCDTYDFSKPKYYALTMFPYPSGIGIHLGHALNYVAIDVITRKKKLEGYNVLSPMGYDSFGLPAEQYAINTGNHPAIFTNNNIATFRSQLKRLGAMFDWSKEISTCDPKFYKWTQWIFTLLFKEGLAKYVDTPVNWCEELATVLANDEVVNGFSVRGNYPVVRKNLKQWVIDIVAYADRLLEGLNDLDWPNSTKEMQRNWIGKSVGASIKFKLAEHNEILEVFTTRPDTIFGVEYLVLAPEHSLVSKITEASYKKQVADYIKLSSSKSELERSELNKDKTGVFIGSYAYHPITNKKLPIYIADYVLASYGSGAVMAVPAHDQRDYEFAKKYNLNITKVIDGDISTKAFTEDGIHINSDFINGLNNKEASAKVIEYLEKHEIGKLKINYKIREWIFSRQRYWGEPIPIIHLENEESICIPLDKLPLLLPDLKDFTPVSTGSPLSKLTDWVNVEVDGKKGKRETNTMPGSAGSSWYFMRYLDPNNDKEFADRKLLDHWLPVDLYIGGSEHVVGHLLYSRMWTNFLYDQNYLSHKEPFKKLFHQGMILGSDGQKMSKSKGNGVNPIEICDKYGADTLRLYLMFLGPLEASKPWSDNNINASYKWLERVKRIYDEAMLVSDNDHSLDYSFNYTVKKVSEDIEKLNHNTAISQLMIFVNDIYKQKQVYKNYYIDLLKMLSCFAPHLANEIYFEITGEYLDDSKWPSYDETKLVKDEIEIVVQVNGKLRGRFNAPSNLSDEELKTLSLQNENVQKFIKDKEIVKMIVIKSKMVNIVVK